MREEFVAPCLTKKLENYIAIKATRPAGSTNCVGTVRKYPQAQGLAGPVAIVATQGVAGKVRFLIVILGVCHEKPMPSTQDAEVISCRLV